MFNKIEDAVAAGLWPASKQTTMLVGLKELEELGYKLFYIGKNADLYFLPGEVPAIIGYRSDRTSVFDIPLDLIIIGKGIIQNQISHRCFDFAESMGINTARVPLPDDLPSDVADRCMAFELCRPIEITIDGERVGLELIFRKFHTGSNFKLYVKGEDSYGLNLPPGLKEWTEFEDVQFTPTTKQAKDLPIRHEIVRAAFPGEVTVAQHLFADGYEYAYERGFVIPDTKFEIFINSEGQFVLGDEALTPESSRYMPRDKFEKGIYVSADKQIIRNYAEDHGWKEMAKGLKPGQKLKVDFPDELKQRVLDGYNSILQIWE